MESRNLMIDFLMRESALGRDTKKRYLSGRKKDRQITKKILTKAAIAPILDAVQ